MNTILRTSTLAPGIHDLHVQSPRIARKCRPGQFLMLRLYEGGERIPLTIADSDPVEGWLRLIVQTVGRTTRELVLLKPGEKILDLAGPLGHPTEIAYRGTVVCVAGGIGAAPILPIARALKAVGNRVIVILGARNAAQMILQKELELCCDRLLLCSDDGSAGLPGQVTAVLEPMLRSDSRPHQVLAIGPVAMMAAVSEMTRALAIPTIVSLNATMVDGTGMCGGCRVSIGSTTRFVCVDGPEFDGHLVDFHELQNRQHAYSRQEHQAMEQPHRCRLERTESALLRDEHRRTPA